MKLNFKDINRGGLGDDIIQRYQRTHKVQQYARDMLNGAKFPELEVYPAVRGLYTLADGIHRLSAYLLIGITSFQCKIVKR